MGEAAGMVLAVLGLFGSCVEGYELISIAKNAGKDSQMLLCQLEIEEKRLLIWGKNAGLSDNTCLIPARPSSTFCNR
jgi:hypothetical protein